MKSVNGDIYIVHDFIILLFDDSQLGFQCSDSLLDLCYEPARSVAIIYELPRFFLDF